MGEEVATGTVCRLCLIPLKGPAPGHTRLCDECFESLDEFGATESWETTPAEIDEQLTEDPVLTDDEFELRVVAYMDTVRQNVQRFGVHIQGVTDKPQFAYTVGLNDLQRPEVIVFSLPWEGASAILNDIAKRVRDDGWTIPVGEPVEGIVSGFPVVFIQVDQENISKYFGVGRRYAGGEFTTSPLQLVWPDPNGKFPWDDEWDPKYSDFQPLLGTL